jgi:hypothetical protein
MFISFDNGAHWQSFQLNLPHVPITDIKVHRKDLVISTQGRAFWILDDISSLHQLGPQLTSTEPHLYRPRDGYRTQITPYGPAIEYYLASAPPGPVTLDILDRAGTIVNSYNSDAPAGGGGRGGRGGRGGAGGGDPDDPDAPMLANRFGRGGAPVSRVTKTEGMNRFIWDVRNQGGLTVPPGAYQARLTVAGQTQTQPFNVLIDPNIAAEGITIADLEEQFEHNTRTRELVTSVNDTVARLRDAQAKVQGTGSERGRQLESIAARLLTEAVRYGKPGLQAHITYLAGMTTRVDQKIGRDAIERYNVLKKELEAVRLELDRVLGSTNGGR